MCLDVSNKVSEFESTLNESIKEISVTSQVSTTDNMV